MICSRTGYCLLAAVACLQVVLWAGAAWADDRTNWLTGAALERKLDSRETIAWSGQPLRGALVELSRVHQFALMIDRRVDPGQRLELSRQNVALTELLAEVAQSRRLGISQLGPVIYLGPPQVARRLLTLAEVQKEQVVRLPAALRSAWLATRAWQWDDLTTPRELLDQLARQGRFEIENVSAVPHDLWSAGDLPPLTLLDRLLLVLVQFDKSFEFTGAAGDIRLVEMPANVWIEKSYPAGRQPQQTIEQIKQSVPDAEVRVEGSKVAVRALVEEHERLQNPVRASSAPPSPPKNLDIVTLNLTVKSKPLREVLHELQRQLDLEFRIDAEKLRAAGRSVEDLVSFEVKAASLDATLRAALAPLGLTFRRTGRQVEVFPAEQPEVR